MLTDIVTITDIWPVIEALLKPMYPIFGVFLVVALIVALIVAIVKLRNKK